MYRTTYDTNVFGAITAVQAFLPLLKQCRGRIVNISSTMGSLTDQSDPQSAYYSVVVPAYQSSKAALNALTVAWAKQLAGDGISVLAVCPGFVQTDLTPMNKSQAPTTPEAARFVAEVAMSHSSRTGTFIDRAGVVPW